MTANSQSRLLFASLTIVVDSISTAGRDRRWNHTLVWNGSTSGLPRTLDLGGYRTCCIQEQQRIEAAQVGSRPAMSRPSASRCSVPNGSYDCYNAPARCRMPPGIPRCTSCQVLSSLQARPDGGLGNTSDHAMDLSECFGQCLDNGGLKDRILWSRSSFCSGWSNA